jgi:hypothetical protein
MKENISKYDEVKPGYFVRKKPLDVQNCLEDLHSFMDVMLECYITNGETIDKKYVEGLAELAAKILEYCAAVAKNEFGKAD